MKKRNIMICTAVLLAALTVVPAGCGREKNSPDKKTEKSSEESKKNQAGDNVENTMEAVYLKDDQGNSIFVDLANETPFFGTIPQGEVYDEDGKKLEKDQLNNGDVVDIQGNGIMAQSFPGQYHGITKILRKEQKSEKYIEKYQGLLQQFIVQEDPAKIPDLDISYTQPQAIVTAVVETTGTYTWTYEDENGEQTTVNAGGPYILQWQEITEISLSEATQAELRFSKTPETIEAARWEETKKMSPDSLETPPEGESVEVTENQEGVPVITAEPGYIYLVHAVWENGEAEYGFQTKK